MTCDFIAEVHSFLLDDAAFFREWLDLERAAMEANAYLSPGFGVAAIKHLSDQPTKVIRAYKKLENRKELVGLMLVTYNRNWRTGWIKCAELFCSRHSYISGTILHKDYAERSLQTLILGLKESLPHCHIIRADVLTECEANIWEKMNDWKGCRWSVTKTMKRAMLDVRLCNEAYIKQNISRRRLKDIKRRQRRLHEMGHVEWRMVFPQVKDLKIHVEEFLRLEHMGWKGEGGSSLYSNKADISFFRECSEALAEKAQIFFCELLVDDEIVASSVNFIVGGAGFAFKIGWNPNYAKYSVMKLCEYELVRNSSDLVTRLHRIDSGAVAGSYLDDLWPEQKKMVNGMLSLTKLGRFAMTIIERIRRCKSSMQFKD